MRCSAGCSGTTDPPQCGSVAPTAPCRQSACAAPPTRHRRSPAPDTGCASFPARSASRSRGLGSRPRSGETPSAGSSPAHRPLGRAAGRCAAGRLWSGIPTPGSTPSAPRRNRHRAGGAARRWGRVEACGRVVRFWACVQYSIPTLTGPTAGHPRDGPARRDASRPATAPCKRLRVGVVRDASNEIRGPTGQDTPVDARCVLQAHDPL